MLQISSKGSLLPRQGIPSSMCCPWHSSLEQPWLCACQLSKSRLKGGSWNPLLRRAGHICSSLEHTQPSPHCQPKACTVPLQPRTLWGFGQGAHSPGHSPATPPRPAQLHWETGGGKELGGDSDLYKILNFSQNLFESMSSKVLLPLLKKNYFFKAINAHT